MPRNTLLRSPPKSYGSEPALDKMLEPEMAHRKRKHGDDFTEAFQHFSKEITDTLNNWKSDFELKLSLVSNNVSDVIQKDLATLTETTLDIKSELLNVRMECSNLKNNMQSVNTRYSELAAEVSTLQKSTEFNSCQIDSFQKKIDNVSQNTSRLASLEAEVAQLKIVNCQLINNINDNEQRDRIDNLELIGIPELQNENLLNILETLAKKVGVHISPGDIMQAHRVTPRTKLQGRPRVVVAKMSTRLLRDNIISGARKLRLTTTDIGIHGTTTPIFVNEHLTFYNKQLLKKCKEVGKAKLYQYVWSKNGRILIKKNDTSRAIQIRREEDLKDLM